MKVRGTVPLSFLLPEWLRAPVLSIGCAKEVREIFPYALVSALTSLLWLLGPGPDAGVLNAAWVAGELATVAMGAAMFGHEFTHRTVSLMLVQPVTRAEIWRRKMQVLGVAMGVVVVCRLAGTVLHGNPGQAFTFAGLMSLSGVGYGLLVAPLMAILSRGTLAGTVFTVALPAISWQVAGLAALARFGIDGWNSAAATDLTATVFVILVAAQWIIAPFLSRLMFLRLEAADARGLAIRLPRWLGRTVGATPSRGGWLPKVAGKELRLLAPAVLVAGLYLAVSLTEIVLERVGGPRTEVTSLASFIYAGLVSLLVGALACAEERQAGTLLWQLVQPVAAGRQWAIKAGVAIVAALLLALGVPWLVWLIHLSQMPPEALVGVCGFGGTPVSPMDYLKGACQVTTLCVIGLYASSASPNALRAMLWSVPAGLVFVTLFNGLLADAGFHNAFFPLETADRSFLSPAGVLAIGFWMAVLAGVLAVVLGCAFRNFRRLDLRPARVFTHLLVMAASLGGASLACLVFAGAIRASGIVLPEQPPTREGRLAAECDANLAAIETALSAWYTGHSNTVPASLLALGYSLGNPRILVCPADESRRPATEAALLTPDNVGYEYSLLDAAGDPPQTAQVRCPLHGGTRVFPVFARYGMTRYGTAPTASTASTSLPGPARELSAEQLKELQSRVSLMMRHGLVPRTTNALFGTVLRYNLVPHSTNTLLPTNAPAGEAPAPGDP